MTKKLPRDISKHGYGVNLEILPKSQVEAEDVGSLFFFTGKECKHGHLSAKYTKGGRCTWCTRQQAAKHFGKVFTGQTPRALVYATRLIAHENEDVTYIPHKPCKLGHFLRWTASNNCVECDKITQERNRELKRARYFEKTYGITIDELDALFKKQKGKCKICDQKYVERRAMHIDHCHHTKKIRGLLCSRCNQAIGLLQEDPKIIRKAAEYIDAHAP